MQDELKDYIETIGLYDAFLKHYKQLNQIADTSVIVTAILTLQNSQPTLTYVALENRVIAFYYPRSRTISLSASPSDRAYQEPHTSISATILPFPTRRPPSTS